MNHKHKLKLVLIIAALVTGSVPAVNFAASLFGPHGLFPNVHAQGGNDLGFDCGLGTLESTPNTGTLGPNGRAADPPFVGDNALDPSCTWQGDADNSGNVLLASDGTLEPLVSDVLGATSTGGVGPTYGGGFNVEVRLSALNTTINGYDITVKFDQHLLQAVKVDTSGTGWDPNFPPAGSGGVQQLAFVIDNTAGTVRLAEDVLGLNEGADAAGGSTLFRIRFDVVGVGVSPLTFQSDTITQPAPVPHNTGSGQFDSQSFFAAGGVTWNLFWTFSPNPEIPGSPITFTATASCAACTLPLTYRWDYDSNGDGSGPGPYTFDTSTASNTVSFTAPPGPNGSTLSRVNLNVTDAAGNTVRADQRMPFVVGPMSGPSPLGVGVAGSYAEAWLGGIPPYTATWRLCPGSASPVELLVCSNPAASASGTGQTNSQPETYHFGGVFSNTATVKDTASGGYAGSTVLNTRAINITGTPKAYTVTNSANVTSPAVGQPVAITATMAYPTGTAGYPAYSEAGDTVVNGTAPAFGSAIRTSGAALSSGTIWICDTVPPGTTCSASGNKLWDPTEWVFNTTCTLSTCSLSSGTLKAVLYHGSGAQPTSGALVRDTRFKFSDTNTNTKLDAGEPVIYDVVTAGTYDASFTATFNFGDGSSVTCGSTGSQVAPCLPASGGFTITASHSYSSQGTFPISIVAQENSVVFAPSKIQETGFSSITVGPGGSTLCTAPVGGCDFTVSPASPTAGSPATFTAHVHGGTPAYTLSWNFGDSSPAGSGNNTSHTYAAKGTYTVILTITDSASGSSTVTHAVTVVPLTLQATIPITCASAWALGVTVGTLTTCTAQASGGTAPYTFLWLTPGGTPASTSGASLSVSYAVKGTYTIRLNVTDNNGAKATQTAPILVNAQPIVVTVTCGAATVGKPVTCNAGATGGTSPITFSWSAPGGSPASGTGASFIVTYAAKGTFVVNATATDNNGVKAFKTASIVVGGQPVVVTVSCGTATVGKPVACNASATGGTTPYTFSWSAPGGSPATGTGLGFTTTYAAKGTFVVNATATDNNGAKAFKTASVVVAGQPLAVTVSCGTATVGKPVTCNASATGGTGPYTFSWSAPGGSPASGTGPSLTVTYAAKGTFVVNATATDNNGAKAFKTASIVVAGQPLAVTVSCGTATVGKPVTCNASATGGTGPYTFSWSAPGGSPASGTGSGFTTTYAAKGTFVVNATATDNNGAKAFKNASIVVAGQPVVVTVSCGTATVGKPVTCNASATGGTAPYTFSWSAPGGSPASGTGSGFTTTYSAKGTFVVNATATDNNGAKAFKTASIVVGGQPIVVTVTCGTATVGKPVACSASATGGTAPYTFSWSAPGGSPATGTGASFTVTYAAKGTFVVNATATDNNGAKAFKTASVVVAGQPIVVTVSCGTATAGKPVACSASATGGTAPYTFSWSAPGGSPATGTGASFTVTYAAKGTFVVNATATDNNGAKAFKTASIVVAAQPLVVTVSCTAATVGKPVTCNASATGGTAPYTFSWSAPGATTTTGTGPSFTTSYATKGTFVVNATATDNNGAKAFKTASINVAGQNFVVTVSCGTATVGKPVNCTASATGGTPPYTFSWSAPGGNPSTGSGTSFTTTYSTKGTFVVNATATDNNNSKAFRTASVVVAGQALVVTVSCGTATVGKPVACSASATGGTAPYTFSWSAPGGSPATGTGASFTVTYAAKGTFVVNATATDNNGAKAFKTASVVVAGQPIVVTVTCGTATVGKPVACNASATGGTAPYTFSWSAPGGSPATGTGASFTVTYSAKGTFVVNATATDNNGAKAFKTANVVVAGQAIVVTVTCGTATVGKPVTCNASATGGTAPYTFSWSAPGGNPASGTGASFTTTYSAKGTFVVNATATDNNAKKAFKTASIVVAGQPIVVTVSCGTATAAKPVACSASATGGTAPYTFSWSAPGGSPASGTGASFTVTYAAKGTFVVNATATDNNGAKAFKTASIVVAAQPLVVTVSCAAATSGKPVTCNASATGGTAPYTFSWSAPGGNPVSGTGASFTTTYAAKGTFVVNATATDNNGAKAFKTASINVAGQNFLVTVTCGTATVGKPVNCTASASGGTPPYTFTWSAPGGSPSTGSGTSFTTTYSTKGTFVVNATATDNNNSKAFKTASVVVTGQALVVTTTCGTATVGKPVACSASATGGTPPYTFSWSAPGGSPASGTGASFTVTYAAKGTFVVNATATDNNGAKAFKTASVVVAGQPIVVTVTCGTATVGKPVACSASATGGTAPYTFSWSAPGGSPASGTGASFTVTYSAKGTFVVNATATDNNGAKAFKTASIVVGGQPIVVTVTCGTATVGKPVACNASATGGTAPYTFSWSAPGGSPTTGTGASFTVTYSAKGTFVVNATATDNNGAKAFKTASIVVGGQPIVVTVTCGTATVGKPVACSASATGGTAPYTFSWSAPGGSPTSGTGASFTVTYAAKGTFVVNATATDNNAKKAFKTASIVVAGQPIVVTVTCGTATVGKPVTCNASASGGTPPFTFSWSAPGGSPASGTGASFTVTYAAKGTFVVNATATDNNGSKAFKTASIVVAGQPIVVTVTCGTATAGKPVTCNASATGGTAPYTFSWSAPGGNPASGTGSSFTTTYAAKGTFVVNATATDNNGAKAFKTASIVVGGQPIVVTVTCGTATVGKPVACSASATGGTAPYTFSWSAPGGSPISGTGPSFTVTYAAKGTFVVNATATDNNGAKAFKTASIVVAGQPIVVTVTCGTATVGKPVSCSASATGGTPPYTFSWSAPGGSPASGTGASFTVTYAAKGTFVVNATATDNNGAKAFKTANVVVAGQAIVVTVTCGTATVGKPVTCNASATGGTPPFTFSWSAPGGSPATGSGTSFTTTYGAKGTFVVNATATDNNGAKAFKTANVVVAGQAIVVTVTCGTATAGKPVTCNASATGGTAPYTFSWSAPGGSPTSGTGSSFTVTYGVKGTFVVNATATDNNGAKAFKTASIVVAAQPITVTINCGSGPFTAGKALTCNATTTGGTTPFTFAWASKGSPATGTGSSYSPSFTSGQTGPQTINVTATDHNNVPKLGQLTVNIQAQGLIITVTCPASGTAGKAVTCTATTTGGAGTVTISWSSNGSPATGTGSSYTTTLATKGTLNVNGTATDSNVPPAHSSQVKSVLINGQPIVVTVTCGTATVGKPVTCNASAVGGTAPFTFSWSAPGGNPATGTGSSFTTTYGAKGTFVVNATATDNNGAKVFKTASVVVTGQALVVTVTCGSATVGKPVTCNASASGGTPPYTFSWSAPGGSPASGSGTSFTTTYGAKGTFVVNATATDNNAGKAFKTASVVVAGQPIVVTVTCGTATVGKPVTCNASATGGTAPYTFSWSAPGGSPASGTGSSFTVTYAAKGTFVVNATATDNNGAKAFKTASIVVGGQPIVVTVTCGTATVGKPVTCNASATGGTAPYTFSWSAPGGSPTSGTGASFTVTYAAKGTFVVNATATDNNAKKAFKTASIVVAGQPIVVTVTCGTATVGKPVTCNASATGGSPPFTFSWSAPGGSPATGSGTGFTTTYGAKGTFVVNATATDNNGAKAFKTASIAVAGQPIVVTVTCGAATVGKPVTCNASATGGTAPYTFSWSAPGGSPAAGSGTSFTTTYAAKGTFVVNATATDNNGAHAFKTASINVAGQNFVVTVTCGTATVGKPVTCNASASGGTPPYTFSWSALGGNPSTGAGTSFTTTYGAKGTFVVNATATDNNNSKAFRTASVVVTGQALVVTVSCGTATVGKPVSCNASATGGTPPYTFSWSAPGGNPASGTGASFTTTYPVKSTFVVNATATDNNGAKAFKTASVVVAPQPIVVTPTCGAATVGKPVTCNVSATGGTPPYSFSWSAPGGNPATGTGASFTTTYSAKGTFVINATVSTDQNGAKAFKTTSINVAGQNFMVAVTCGTATVGKPVTCNASATGGTPPYTFSWSAPGANPATGSGTSFTTTYGAKGTFVVNATATDNNNSKAFKTASVVVAGQPVVVTVTCGTATVGKPVTCNASATGGTPPYTFSWSAPGGSPTSGTGASFTVTYAAKGTFVVNATATDNNGSKAFKTASVVVVGQPIVVTVTCGTATVGKPVTCNASATGGTAPYTFSWSAPGGNPASGTGSSFTTTYSAKGTFVVNATATDNNGAKAFKTASIVVRGQPIVVSVTCGTATVGKPVTCNASATGGTAPYTFSWSAPGANPATGSGSSFTTTYSTKGTFVVNATATDNNGSKAFKTASIVVTGQPIVVTVTCGAATSGKPVTCNASATGGTPPYTFSWSAPGGSPSTGTGASFTTTYSIKGTFVVNATATDNNGAKAFKTATVIVAPQPIVVSVTCGAATVGKPVTCNASATGGTAPYTFSWSAPGGNPASGAGSSFTTTYATKGTFVVNATATDPNSSRGFKTASINVAGQNFMVTVTCGTATVGKPVTCNASATGGTPPYTFSWSAPGGSPATGSGTSFTTSYAAKGTFVVNATATDNNNSKASKTANVVITGQPVVVTVTCGTATIGKPVTCNASATGGTPPYTFSWSAPGGNPATGTGGSFMTTYPTKGTFTVNATATDNNGAKAFKTASITVAGQPLVVSVSCGAATVGKPVTCNASATGGTPPVTFSWSAPGGSPASGTGSSFTTSYATKGNFVINATATDNNGAKAFKTASINVAGQNFIVSVTCGTATAGKPVTCNASATGGTPPYTFSWSAPGANPATGTGSSFTTTYATKGTFVVNATATDNNNSKAFKTAGIPVSGQGPLFTITCGAATAGKPVTCNASATGGTPPYTVTWSASGGNPSTGSGSSFTTTYAVKGTFVVNANLTDNNGVRVFRTASVVVTAQALAVSITQGAVATVGKPVTFTSHVSGGTSPYSYQWSADGAAVSGATLPTFTTSFSTPGPHSVSVNVTDFNHASTVASMSFTVVAQGVVITVTCPTSGTAGKPVICNATAVGGTPPYTFTWSSNGSPATGSGASYTTSLATKGTLNVTGTVTDSVGATNSKSVLVPIGAQPLMVSVTCGTATAGKPVTCNASASGGTAPYTFSWSSTGNPLTGAGSSYTTTFAAKGSQTVMVTVTDSNNVQKVGTATFNVAAQPIVVTVICGTATAGKPVTCTASATGGTAPYRFSWSSNGSPASGTGSSYITTFATKGMRTVSATATDANNVTSTKSTTFNVAPQALVVTVTCGTATAGKPFSCSVSATGGTAPYTGTGTFTFTIAAKGSVTKTFNVTDSNGVSAISSAVVNVAPQQLMISASCGTATAGKPVTCSASASGGTGPYTFSWTAANGSPSSGTGSSFTVTFAAKGTVTVIATVKDMNGATVSSNVQVIVTAQPLTVTFTFTPTSPSAGKPVSFSATATGGTTPYSFQWNFGDGTTGTGQNPVHTYAVKGTYSVTAMVTDMNGATASANRNLVVAPQVLMITSASGTPNPGVAGQPVSFLATITGGTTPYMVSWNFGDTNTGTGNPTSHTYTAAGNYTVTVTARDANNATSNTFSFTFKVVTVTVSGSVVVTDGSLCSFTSPFKLIFITDSQNPNFYRLVSSNPGQFADNVFATGAPGTPVSLNINLPYPFITQGGSPIQVYSGFTMSGGCFMPTGFITSQFTITAPGPMLSNGSPSVVLSNYAPQNFNSTVTINVSGKVPATGTIFVTVHMDYGLKGTTGWSIGPAQGSSFQALNSGMGLTLNNGQPYTFTLSGSASASATISSTNVFKKNPGFAGVVINTASGKPMPGVTVKIYDNNKNLLFITATDQNGVYLVSYKFTGTKTTYSVVAVASAKINQQQSASMQANKVVLANFNLNVPGDVNGDNQVDLTDASLLALSFLSTPAKTNWIPGADVNGDGVIDILDAAIIAYYYGTVA